MIGAVRHRLNGDNLPPLAPSSSTSRRDDLTQYKGPPAGTPRPQAAVAQWAITDPKPRATGEQLTTITSDNELDDDEGKHNKVVQSNKRIISPHPTTRNRTVHDKRNSSSITNNEHDTNNEDDNDYLNNNHKMVLHRNRHSDLNRNDDNNDENTTRRSLSGRKARSRERRNDDEDDLNDNRNKTSSRERFIKKHQDHDNNENLKFFSFFLSCITCLLFSIEINK